MCETNAMEIPAENLLLEELWGIVLENLEFYEDLRSAENACKLFQKLLLPNKKLWLFEQVLPLLFPYINMQSVLTCRKVCKAWNKTVDNSFDNEKLELEWYSTDKRINSFELISHPEAPRSSHIDIVSFTQIMSAHNKNPFIGHSITIKINHLDEQFQAEDYHAVRQRIYNIFERFGRHIYYLKLYVEDHLNRDQDGLKIQLANLTLNHLSLMTPNIRSLKFDCRNMVEHASHLEWSNITELRFTAETFNDLKYLGQIKAPLLEKLEFNPALHSNQQIPHLLKYLHLLIKSSPKLTYLKLNDIAFLTPNISMDPEYAPLTAKIACPENVKILEIEDRTASMSTVYKTFFFNHSVSNYSFLKAFTHVENLKIVSIPLPYVRRDWYKRLCDLKEEIEVHKYLYYGRMYESNIWEIMSKLQTFTFENQIYTRKRYETLKKDA